MVVSYIRGHEIIFKNNKWLFADNMTPLNFKRSCIRCGELPTKEGYDKCLGYIKGVESACCGHGVSPPIMIFKKGG